MLRDFLACCASHANFLPPLNFSTLLKIDPAENTVVVTEFSSILFGCIHYGGIHGECYVITDMEQLLVEMEATLCCEAFSGFSYTNMCALGLRASEQLCVL